MSAGTLRELVAKVLFVSHVSDYAGRTAPEIMDRCDEAADAVLAVVAADTEGIARLTEIIRVEMSKGAYQMLPDELPYESAARRVAAAVAAYLAGEPR